MKCGSSLIPFKLFTNNTIATEYYKMLVTIIIAISNVGVQNFKTQKTHKAEIFQSLLTTLTYKGVLKFHEGSKKLKLSIIPAMP